MRYLDVVKIYLVTGFRSYRVLGYSGNKLNGTTNCTGKLQIFEVVKADDSGHNKLQ